MEEEVPDSNKWRIFDLVSKRTGATTRTVKRWYQMKELLAEWVEKNPTGKTGVRVRGCHTPEKKLASCMQGQKLVGKRGYLGRIDHCREFVLQTRVWAETEAARGHALSGLDLVTHFRNRLDKAMRKPDEHTLPE